MFNKFLSRYTVSGQELVILFAAQMYCSAMARKRYAEEVVNAAKGMFLRRYTVREISDVLTVPRRTIHEWKTKDCWEDLRQSEHVEDAIHRRLVVLIEREEKTERNLKEIERLTTTLERLSRMRLRETCSAITGGGVEPDAKSSAGNGNGHGGRRQKGKKKPVKNDVSHLTIEDFKEKLHVHFFDYQKEVYAERERRNRFVLKSRQIGFTWYFAQEAFERACLTGTNQIFLSATKNQAQVFRKYIRSIAKDYFDIELKGTDRIELHTAKGTAELIFLSTSTASAQSYNGDLYIDECFWIQNFEPLYKVASAMASQKHLRKTLFSTPSSVTHQAYPMWAGEKYNKRNKVKKVAFPTVEQMRKNTGIECPDSWWRRVITIDDALECGCTLFDREQLLMETDPDEFRNLFLCEFISGLNAVFKFGQLERCFTSPKKWKDFDPKSDRPFGDKEVWCGFDPSRSRDDASFVVLAPPEKANGDFRVLERYRWFNKSFRWQAAEIEKITERYNVKYLGVDTTGIGAGVFELVQEFYPQVTKIHYSLETKISLVLKAKMIIESGRIKWDEDLDDIARAFLTIRQDTTKNGMVTYSSQRTSTTGHADVAWAIMHALLNEPLTGKRKRSCVVIGE